MDKRTKTELKKIIENPNNREFLWMRQHMFADEEEMVQRVIGATVAAFPNWHLSEIESVLGRPAIRKALQADGGHLCEVFASLGAIAENLDAAKPMLGLIAVEIHKNDKEQPKSSERYSTILETLMDSTSSEAAGKHFIRCSAVLNKSDKDDDNFWERTFNVVIRLDNLELFKFCEAEVGGDFSKKRLLKNMSKAAESDKTNLLGYFLTQLDDKRKLGRILQDSMGNGCIEASKMLLDAGADPAHNDCAVLRYAIMQDRRRILKLLEGRYTLSNLDDAIKYGESNEREHVVDELRRMKTQLESETLKKKHIDSKTEARHVSTL